MAELSRSQLRDRIEAKIRSDGYAFIHRDFAYPSLGIKTTCSHTAGLARRGYPELVALGFEAFDAQRLFAKAYALMKNGDLAPQGARDDLIQGLTLAPILAAPHALGAAAPEMSELSGRSDFQCIQLLAPDPSGHFPWESAYDATAASISPLLASGSELDRSEKLARASALPPFEVHELAVPRQSAPPLSIHYTDGLVRLGIPELLATGLEPSAGTRFVRMAALMLSCGALLPAEAARGPMGSIVACLPIDFAKLLPILGPRAPLYGWTRIDPDMAWQIAIADSAGRFASSPACDPAWASASPVFF